MFYKVTTFLEEQIAIIYCGVNGLLNNVPVNKIKECEREFIKLMHKDFGSTLVELKNGKLTDEITENIQQALDQVLKNFN